MKIDDSIVLGYLQGSDDYEKHWLFYQISENCFLNCFQDGKM